MALSDSLRYLKGQNRFTQEFIADKIGVHFTTYGRYERGEITPPMDVMKKLANLYGMSIDMLQGYDMKLLQVADPVSEYVATHKNKIDIVVHLDGNNITLQRYIDLLRKIHQAMTIDAQTS